MGDSNLELEHVSSFLDTLGKERHKILRQDCPEPDFLFIDRNRRIGIEHTRLIRQRDKDRFDIKAHSVATDKIMNQAQTLFTNKINRELNIDVAVDFVCGYETNHKIWIRNDDIKKLSEWISNFVFDKITCIEQASPGHYEYFDEHNEFGTTQEVPESIEGICIVKNREGSCWSANQGGTVPSLFKSNELKERINEKNRKPSNYKEKYDELWLLIVENSANLTSYFHIEDIDQAPTFKSNFDRIIVFRVVERNLINLKIEKI